MTTVISCHQSLDGWHKWHTVIGTHSLPPGRPWGTSHKTLNWKLWKKCVWFNFDTHDPISSQFCTSHDSLAVVACAKLWLDWIIILYDRATCIFARFGLRAHTPFVKQVPGTVGATMESKKRHPTKNNNGYFKQTYHLIDQTENQNNVNH